MPLYEYQCDACGHRFERIQKFSDPPASECPKCGGVVKKLISSPAFQFKGSGWYATDYAKKSEGSGKSDKGDAASGESKDSGSKDTKETKDTKDTSSKDSTTKDSGSKASAPTT